MPVRDLRGRYVKHRDYSKGQKPVRPPIDNPKPPEEGFWIGPSITVGAGDYLPRDRSQRQERNECLAASSGPPSASRSEEHTSELQSLMRISYAVFCLKKKK